jgi:hypothetical protein
VKERTSYWIMAGIAVFCAVIFALMYMALE